MGRLPASIYLLLRLTVIKLFLLIDDILFSFSGRLDEMWTLMVEFSVFSCSKNESLPSTCNMSVEGGLEGGGGAHPPSKSFPEIYS